MSLREILAELDMEVRGLGKVEAADRAVDRFKETLSPAIREVDRLRVKSAEYAETASKLAAQIRKLQKAEGDHSGRIGELRVAHGRMQAAAASARTEAAKLDGTWKQSTGGLTGLVAGFGAATAAIGAVVAATAGLQRVFGGIADAVSEVIATGDALDNASKRTGMSVAALQEWQYAADRSGVSAEALQRAFMVLGRNAAGAGADGIEALGVSTKNADGSLRAREAIFSDTIAALAGMTNGTARAAAAQKVFGKSGAELLTLINEGPDGIARLRDRFHELGGGLTDDVVTSAAEADDGLTDMRTAMASLESVLVADLLPPIASLTSDLATLVGGVIEFLRTSSTLETILGGLAVAFGVLALAMAPILIPTIAVVAAFVALFLVVEDIVTAFRGGKSVIGGWLSELTGVGTAAEFFETAWANAIANISQGFAGLMGIARSAQRAMGIDTAASGADAAVSQAGDWAASAQARLRSARAAARDQPGPTSDPAAALVPAAAQVQQRQRATGRTGGRAAINVPTTINVNGALDPAAVAREVSRQHARRVREAHDTIALAADDGED